MVDVEIINFLIKDNDEYCSSMSKPDIRARKSIDYKDYIKRVVKEQKASNKELNIKDYIILFLACIRADLYFYTLEHELIPKNNYIYRIRPNTSTAYILDGDSNAWTLQCWMKRDLSNTNAQYIHRGENDSNRMYFGASSVSGRIYAKLNSSAYYYNSSATFFNLACLSSSLLSIIHL